MAASLAVNNKEEIANRVDNYNVRLLTFMSSKVEDYKKQFNYMISKAVFTDSTFVYRNKQQFFENLCGRFDYISSELINLSKNRLNKIKSEYVIRHPCKIQLDSSKSRLNEIQTRLVDAMNYIVKTNRYTLDGTVNEFKVLSDKFISAQNFRLKNVKTSYVIQNPCKIQLDKSGADLNLSKDNVIRLTSYKVQSSQKDFENILNSNLFKNPDSVLDKHKQRLDVCREKLDKINQVIELKRNQEKQKANYRKIIVAIVAIVIIVILLILNGGI